VTSDAGAWDAELERLASPAPLLQSWAWGEVQSRAGWSIERVRLDGAMASVQTRGVGPLREAYVPRGPVPATADSLASLARWAKERGLVRIRVEPDAPPALGDQLRELGFTRVQPVQPERTRILELGAPDAVLARIDRGTRYNIRLAERRGVVVEEGRDAAELVEQSKWVAAREAISLPSRAYYESLLELLPWCRTYVGRDGESGEALCAVLVARFAGRGYNLFAGRSGAHADLKANELAHWHAIRGAAGAGLGEYDLWGVPPPGAAADHPWSGLGKFKAGFGGRIVDYAGAWEMQLSKGARLLDVERSTRRAVRRLRRNMS
jgi:peptidoglycan pentaglycine glycine transferase (the first glycine)